MSVSPTRSGVVEAANFGRINVKYFPPSTTETCFNINETITLTANPNSGYQFSRWSITGGASYSGTSNPYTFRMPSSSSVTTTVVAYFTGVTPPPPEEAEPVTLDEAKAMIDGTNPVIVIDVQDAAAYRAGHIVCAQNYPWSSGDLERRYTELSNYIRYNILVYGDDRSPSDDAADFLAGKGFTSVYHMTDGLNGWKGRGWHAVDSACDCETCSLPPMAHAGPDQTVDEGDRVTLDGSKSSAAVDYFWLQVDGVEMVALSDETAAKPTFTAPYVQQGGDTLVFHLTVSDVTGRKDTDSVSINVEWVNTAVNADAGADQSVMAGDTVILDGSGSSDPDGVIASYLWEVFSASSAIDPSAIDISNPTSRIASFLAPDARGWVQFRLTVTDDDGGTDSDNVMITVNTEGGETGLVSDAGPDQPVAESTMVMLSGSWSTSLGSPVTSWQWAKVSGPPVVLSGSDGMAPEASRDLNPTFIAPLAGEGQAEIVFQFIVKDAMGRTDSDEVAVLVNSQAYIDASQPPVADAGPDQDVAPGALVTLDGSGSSDPEGKLFLFEWMLASGPESIVLSNPSAAQPTFTAPFVSGSAIFQLIVMDDTAKTDQDTVEISWDSEPPVADAGPDQNVFENETVVLYGSGSSDPDDGIETYQWTQIDGPPVVLSGTTLVNPVFTAPAANPGTKILIFALTVKDYSGQTSTDQVEIAVNNKNDAPTADAGPDQRVNETAMVSLDAAGSFDPDGDRLSYAWRQISGPVVSRLTDADTAAPVLWAPSIGVAQAKVIMELTVSDPAGLTSTDRMEITVDDVGKAPLANAGQDMAVYERQIVTLDGTGSKDIDGSITYLWIQTGGRTAILSDVSAAAPTFTVPTVQPDANVLTFLLMVTDNDGLVAFDEVILTVAPATGPPVADAGPDQTVVEKDMVILDGSGSSDPDDGIVSYEWAQTSGTGVVLSDTSAIKPAFEAPDISDPSMILSFRLTVTDASGQARVDFVQITVNRKSGGGGGGGGGCFISSIND